MNNKGILFYYFLDFHSDVAWLQGSGSSVNTTVQNEVLEESMSHLLTNYNEATFQSEQTGDSDEATFHSDETGDSDTLHELQPSTSQSSSCSLTQTIEWSV